MLLFSGFEPLSSDQKDDPLYLKDVCYVFNKLLYFNETHILTNCKDDFQALNTFMSVFLFIVLFLKY